MNNLSLSIILLFAVLVVFIINYKNSKVEIEKIKSEQNKYNDFVKSFSAINIKPEEQISKDPLPEQQDENIVDVYSADAELLLKSLKQKDENIENQN